MSRYNKPSSKTNNAFKDIDPKDAGTLAEKLIKVLQDWLK